MRTKEIVWVLLSQCRHIGNCWNEVAEFAHGSEGSCAIADGRIFDAKGNLKWEYPRMEGGKRRNLHYGHQQEHHDLFAVLRQA